MNPRLTLIEWKLLQWMAKPRENGCFECFSYRNGKVSFHRDFTAPAKRAALKLLKAGWVTADEFKSYRLNEAGKHAASTIPRPEWAPPKPPVLRDEDYYVLWSLERSLEDERWRTPLDCGGTNGSHHSASLVKLVQHGFAECRQRGIHSSIVCGPKITPEPRLAARGKGSREFRITPAGMNALLEWKAQKDQASSEAELPGVRC